MLSQRVVIRFPGTRDGFAQAFGRLSAALDSAGLAGATRFNTELVFEELVANIVEHGGAAGRELTVAVTLETRSDSVVLAFEDDGVPFDPRAYDRPARVESLEERRPGGFGLMLVRHAATSLDYARTAAGHNQVTITLPRLEAAR